MGQSKFLTTPKLEIQIQLTETTAPEAGGRAWEVHDVERNRGFFVRLSGRSLGETGPGREPLNRPFSESDIEGGLGLAIERALTTPPEKVAGTLYDVSVTSQDLHEAARSRSR
jgi:hypothetical protein